VFGWVDGGWQVWGVAGVGGWGGGVRHNFPIYTPRTPPPAHPHHTGSTKKYQKVPKSTKYKKVPQTRLKSLTILVTKKKAAGPQPEKSFQFTAGGLRTIKKFETLPAFSYGRLNRLKLDKTLSKEWFKCLLAPLHGSCPAAVADYQTACMRMSLTCCSCSFSNCIQVLCSHLQWQDTKLHERGGFSPAAVTGYQTACAHGCPAAVAGSQTAFN
jgi:hypothetical protein